MSVYEGLTETQQFACRVIADHARSTAFSIADGILPGNEGRNYVLRKIMRRAIYHGREHLGFKELFFYKVCDFVVAEMHDAFPELEVQRDFIGKMVRLEEERFGNTLSVGLKRLEELIETKGSEIKAGIIDFTELAKLYDSFGVPSDLIRVMLEQKGFGFWETGDEFDSSFDFHHKELQHPKTRSDDEISAVSRAFGGFYEKLAGEVGHCQFVGYETTQIEDAEILAIFQEETLIDELSEGTKASVVLNRTPFYAEAGGQVGDVGKLISTDVTLTVVDTYSPVAGLIIHKVKVDKGTIKIGDTVSAIVDSQKRDATRRNHTATHLVHAALREVLGTHVKQGGSVVAPNYLRFDFTHYQPMTEAEIVEVEDLVNRYILENHPVNTNIMAIEEAMRGGAMALFGEKYGSDVRVLSVGVFSKELCGGTHVKATGDIGSFKITSDEAIASGVRRIRAITGFDAFERFREDERLIDRSLGALKTQRDNLPNAIEKLQDELKRTRKEIDELKLKIATGAIGSATSNGDEAKDIAGVKVIGKIVEGLDGNGTRQLSDTLLTRLKSGVVVLGRTDEGKVSIIVRVSDDLTDRVKAGNVIKEIIGIVGGRGGGKPDMAEGGGSEPEKLSEAIDASYAVIEKMLA
jgi:alanyl-tRNA synthetase